MKIVLGICVASIALVYSSCGEISELLDTDKQKKSPQQFTGNLSDSPELDWLAGSWGPVGIPRANDMLFAFESGGARLTIKQVHKLYPKDRSLETKDCYVSSSSISFQLKKVGTGDRTNYAITSEPSHVDSIVHEDNRYNSYECRRLVAELQTRINAWKNSGEGEAWRESFSFTKNGDSIFMGEIKRLYSKGR